jgi:hypothetical protein
MSMRITLLAGAVLTNLVVGVTSVVVVPQVGQHIADAKLDAVIAELATAPAPASRAEHPDVHADSGVRTTPTTGAPAPGRRVPAAVVTPVTPARPSAPPTAAVPLTRAAVDARPPSVGAVPPAQVAAFVDDEFDGKGIARASDEQQLSLAKAVCSAFDRGYSRDEILARALQEEGTTASGVNRFLDVAIATTCSEHGGR